MILQIGPVSANFILFSTNTLSEENEAALFRLQEENRQPQASTPQAHPSIITKHPSKSPKKSPFTFYIQRCHDEIYQLVMHIVLIYWSRHQDFPYFDLLSEEINDISYRIDSILDALRTEEYEEQKMQGTYLQSQELFSNIKIYEDKEFRAFKYLKNYLKFKESFQMQVIEAYKEYLHSLRRNFDKEGDYEKQGQLRRGKIGLQLFQDENMYETNEQASSLESEEQGLQIQYVDPEEEDGDSQNWDEVKGFTVEIEQRRRQEAWVTIERGRFS